jgi:hypothetical protein
MFSTYVLRSKASRRLYTGSTSDLGRRLEQHNTDASTSTKKSRSLAAGAPRGFSNARRGGQARALSENGQGPRRAPPITCATSGSGTFGQITSVNGYNINNDTFFSDNVGTGFARQLQFMLRLKF